MSLFILSSEISAYFSHLISMHKPNQERKKSEKWIFCFVFGETSREKKTFFFRLTVALLFFFSSSHFYKYVWNILWKERFLFHWFSARLGRRVRKKCFFQSTLIKYYNLCVPRTKNRRTKKRRKSPNVLFGSRAGSRRYIVSAIREVFSLDFLFNLFEFASFDVRLESSCGKCVTTFLGQ